MFTEKIEELRGKLGDLCRENGYQLNVQDKAFPIMFLLRGEADPQTSLTDKPEPERPPSAFDIIFADRCVVQWSGKVTLDEDAHKKIVSTAKKLHYLIVQQYFCEKTHGLTEAALKMMTGKPVTAGK
ncbi:MAG: hypothetical protein FWG72_06220 [Oscillospiraceae bacterium]|nr:hypothetical protein [Oscillospiraceae bacterium]